MKTRILVTLLTLLVLATMPLGASARDGSVNPETLEPDTSIFRGGGAGVKVELRTRYHKIVFALITTTFYCTDSSGQKSQEQIRAYLGNKGLMIPNLDWPVLGAVPIHRDGRFNYRTNSDEIFTWIENFKGRAGAKRIGGQFRLHIIQEDSDCQTKSPTSSSQYLSFGAHRVKKH